MRLRETYRTIRGFLRDNLASISQTDAAVYTQMLLREEESPSQTRVRQEFADSLPSIARELVEREADWERDR